MRNNPASTSTRLAAATTAVAVPAAAEEAVPADPTTETPTATPTETPTETPTTNDKADYTNDKAGVLANLELGWVSRSVDGVLVRERLVAINHLVGSAFADTLVGNNSSNTLTGQDGADWLQGNDGGDTLSGGAGDDSLIGGKGDDSLDGGAGWDTVDYQEAAGKVSVNLTAGTASGADGNDTLVGIEAIFGSRYGDALTGDSGNNQLRGRGGNDTIDGGAGTDIADYATAPAAVTVSLLLGQSSGGDGNDTLTNIEGLDGSPYADQFIGDGNDNLVRGNQGNDSLDGGTGTDVVSYRNAPAAVTVDLSLGKASGGDGNDLLARFEGAEGGAYADMLLGDGSKNTLSGLGGNDTLKGGIADDLLQGGDGNDTAQFSGNYADYAIQASVTPGRYTVRDLRSLHDSKNQDISDGFDTLDSVEVLQFADRSITTQAATDKFPPMAISFSPVDGLRGVAVDRNIVLNFNEPIALGQGQITLQTDAGVAVEYFNSYYSSGLTIKDSTLTLDPSYPLAVSTRYFLIFEPGSITDLAGNAYPGTKTYDFTTAKTSPSPGQVISGTAGDDILSSGGSGDDVFYGGEGLDTVFARGIRANYQITKISDTGSDGPQWGIDSTAEGTDQLHSVERLRFTDLATALDINGKAGMLYRLYQAAFGRAPGKDEVGFGYWMAEVDKGMSLVDVANVFINSQEFKAPFNGILPSKPTLVTTFYQNVLHREPDTAGYDWWVSELNSGKQTAAQVLASFSESAENQANLIGAIGNGFDYTPWIG